MWSDCGAAAAAVAWPNVCVCVCVRCCCCQFMCSVYMRERVGPTGFNDGRRARDITSTTHRRRVGHCASFASILINVYPICDVCAPSTSVVLAHPIEIRQNRADLRRTRTHRLNCHTSVHTFKYRIEWPLTCRTTRTSRSDPCSGVSCASPPYPWRSASDGGGGNGGDRGDCDDGGGGGCGAADAPAD